MNTIILFLLFSLIAFQSQADSDGAVAFGDDFVAYTAFSKSSSGQDLNIVVLKANGMLEKVATKNLPISLSKLSTDGNYINLETKNKIYKLVFTKSNTLELINSNEGESATEFLNTPNRKWNEKCDWITNGGDCENVKIDGKSYYLCLAYAEYFSKFKFGTLIFHDKLLISRFVEENISSLLINSNYETIH
jgi:hypothetical protein